jgi:hypothetical protein
MLRKQGVKGIEKRHQRVNVEDHVTRKEMGKGRVVGTSLSLKPEHQAEYLKDPLTLGVANLGTSQVNFPLCLIIILRKYVRIFYSTIRPAVACIHEHLARPINVT